MAQSGAPYPVRFSVDYPDRPLDRLSSFFRLIAAVPIVIVLTILGGSAGSSPSTSFGVAAGALVIAPALMIVFRQKYPRWWFDWNVAFVRFEFRVTAYLLLLRDEYPSTDEEQAVHLEIDYPNVANDLNRYMPIIKWLLAVPHLIVLVILISFMAIAVVIAWFAILLTGRYPRGLFDFVVGVNRWGARVMGYALLMGCAQAFVTPARDALLNTVAEGRVQRTVMLTSMMQFGLQMVGFIVASAADTFGALVIIGTQSVVLLLGVFAFLRIREPDRSTQPPPPPLIKSVLDGGRTVFASPAMRMVMVQNVAMGMFFMGAYIVTMPLLVREVFSGTAQDLAFMNGANSLGLVLTIFLLLRLGDVRRQGRALLLAQGLGAVVLATAGFASQFGQFVVMLFLWGVCGGAAMTMSRTIMQEQAPKEMRGRVMSFYSFSFMGAGPIGALLSGYLVEQIGPQMALLTSSAGMLVVIVVVGFTSGLWRLQGLTPQILSAQRTN